MEYTKAGENDISPPSTPPSKKPLLIIGGIFAFLIIFLIVIIVLIQGRKNQPATIEKTLAGQGQQTGFFNQIKNIILPQNETAKLTQEKNQTLAPVNKIANNKKPENKEAAKIVFNWMGKMKTAAGTYPQDESCLLPTQCKVAAADNTQGAFIIAGYFKYYEKTKDSGALDLLNSALNTYSNNKTVPTIQNSLWNCRLLYEVWKSPLLNKNQKDKVQTICARGLYFPSLTQKVEKDISKGSAGELNLALFQDRQYDKNDTSIKIDDIIQYAVYSSDNSITSVWNKDLGEQQTSGIDWKKAILFFNSAVKTYSKDQRAAEEKNAVPLIGVASLDIYNIGKNKQYRDYSEYLYNKYKTVPCDTLEKCSFKIFFYSQLFKSTGNTKYKFEKESLINNLFYEHFDSANNKGFFDKMQSKIYSVKDNALLIYLLVE